jgi:hypothetical protein
MIIGLVASVVLFLATFLSDGGTSSKFWSTLVEYGISG